MLLLYPQFVHCLLHNICIYIPLCFYFICIFLPGFVKIMHLHSTMLLLYPKNPAIFKSFSSLFTFHYASTLSSVVDSTVFGAPIFTFHYASTLSQGSCRYSEGEEEFTFHYASTLSNGSEFSFSAISLIYIPLCFYFIENSRYFRNTSDCIYIPLCFYFIRMLKIQTT